MSIENWFHDLELAATQPYILRLDVLDRSRSMIKARLVITEDLFIQVYRNDRYDSTNLVLIHNQRRIYGRDQLGGMWHRHTVEAPQIHDRGAEGSRFTSVRDFLSEVEAILASLGLP